jgi:hypothetical protein
MDYLPVITGERNEKEKFSLHGGACNHFDTASWPWVFTETVSFL